MQPNYYTLLLAIFVGFCTNVSWAETDPEIELSTSYLTNAHYVGENAQTQAFDIRNAGSGTLNWTIDANVPWISCTPSSGISHSGDPNTTVTVTYSTSELELGLYTGILTISDSNATNNPQTIEITLGVCEDTGGYYGGFQWSHSREGWYDAEDRNIRGPFAITLINYPPYAFIRINIVENPYPDKFSFACSPGFETRPICLMPAVTGGTFAVYFANVGFVPEDDYVAFNVTFMTSGWPLCPSGGVTVKYGMSYHIRIDGMWSPEEAGPFKGTVIGFPGSETNPVWRWGGMAVGRRISPGNWTSFDYSDPNLWSAADIVIGDLDQVRRNYPYQLDAHKEAIFAALESGRVAVVDRTTYDMLRADARLVNANQEEFTYGAATLAYVYFDGGVLVRSSENEYALGWHTYLGDGVSGAPIPEYRDIARALNRIRIYILADEDPDGDSDGDVDFQDFALFAQHWETADCNSANCWCEGTDFNRNGRVGFDDVLKFTEHWLEGPSMVVIPGGEYQMGDHHDGLSDAPVHAVHVDSFYMSQYEVTNGLYCDYLNDANSAQQIKVVGDVVYASRDSSNSYPYCNMHSYDSDSQIDYTASGFSVRTKDGNNMSGHPTVQVSWYGAVAYCNWRSSQKGYESCYNLSTWECDFSRSGYRLATEAEWEYAARGGEYTPYYRYPWGNSIDGSKANYLISGDPYETGDEPYTTPVGYYNSYQIPTGTDMANGYGLYDMAGNVWEWCNDWKDSNYYNVSPYDNPKGPGSGTDRIVRGGGWSSYDSNCTVSGRSCGSPQGTDGSIGFRVCRSIHTVVPNVTGMTQAEAQAAIVAASLVVGTITQQHYHYAIPAGNVISSEPVAGTTVNAGSVVNLDISIGPDPTCGMVLVSINDPGVSGHEGFNGQMSKYEITNAQYCQFLNEAKASGDITVSGNDAIGANGSNGGEDFVGQLYYDGDGPGYTNDGATNGGAARIHYIGSVFNVDSGFDNHPVTYVNWYGATAFCNYYGYRLPTEWEWQAVADYDGSYSYGCGTTINDRMANYNNSTHPDGTTAVGAFGMYGYGMCDMAGNLFEWTSSINSGIYRVICGGNWTGYNWYCSVGFRSFSEPNYAIFSIGFRVCR
jgi:formylglycine-generating enzyme required for sulfatase activity